MKTITIQIGNSDNKLTQREWSEFVEAINWQVMHVYKSTAHFIGFSASCSPFQNAAWVIEGDSASETLCKRLANVASRFKQDTIAWTEGDTRLVLTL